MFAGLGVLGTVCTIGGPVIPSILPEVSTIVTPCGIGAGVVVLGTVGGEVCLLTGPSNPVAGPIYSALLVLFAE